MAARPVCLRRSHSCLLVSPVRFQSCRVLLGHLTMSSKSTVSSKVLTLLVVLCLCTSIAQARTWRTTDERKFSGDFQGLEGNQVVIRTTSGRIEKVSYLKLSKSDRTFVKSTLTSMAKQDEVQRLIQLETQGTSGKPANPATPADDKPAPPPASTEGASGSDSPLADGKQMRIWTDVNGKQLEARFVSANQLQVTLQLASGEQHNFPIAGFRTEDQQLIRQLSDQPAGGQPGSSGGPGMPPGTPGFPGFPGTPGAPSFPGAPGNTPGPGLSGGGFPGGAPGSSAALSPGFPGAGLPGGTGFPPGAGLPNAPGAAVGPGLSGPPGGPGMGGFPGTPSLPSAPQTAGSPLGSPNPDAPAFESSQPGPGMPPSGGPGFRPPTPPSANFGPPGAPPVNNPGSGIPAGPEDGSMDGFEWIYKCEDCGAEFTEADGVKEGDSCPKCPWYKRLRMRNVGRLIGFAVFLAIGGISFVARKLRGT